MYGHGTDWFDDIKPERKFYENRLYNAWSEDRVAWSKRGNDTAPCGVIIPKTTVTGKRAYNLLYIFPFFILSFLIFTIPILKKESVIL